MPKKEPALIVRQATLSVMVLQHFVNNVFNVATATESSFGNDRMLRNAMSFPGLNFGSKKATPFEDFQNFPDTAPSKSNKLKIIGFLKLQNPIPIFQRSNTLFTTAPISGKTTALSPS